MKHILFCGGGSAGHVVPNLALINELKFSHRISYMGTGGIEKDVIGNIVPFYEVNCPKLVRSFTLRNLRIPMELRAAKRKAIAVFLEIKPDVVFSKGGFASLPAVLAAEALRVPVLTHESDLSPGLSTKLSAKKCRYVLTSFPETAALFPNGRYVSSPIRKEIFFGDRRRALHKYGFSEEKPVLLVAGGGSGSRAINEAVFSQRRTLLKYFQILHLCGRGNLPEETAACYVAREYETDMGSAYAACDLIVCRAGSNTVFEAIALKKPTLFVPLEKCSRGDQLQNALYFQRKGLCGILRESELGGLSSRLLSLSKDGALKAALKECDVKNGTPLILELMKETEKLQSGASENPPPKISACK